MKKRSIAWGVAGAAGLAGAGFARNWWKERLGSGPREALGDSLAGGGHSVEHALFQATGLSFTDGNRISWCHDEVVFEQLFCAARAAEHSIHFDMYIFKPGALGGALADVLCERAREGIAVRVLVDPMGSPGFEEQLCPKLRKAGCEVRYFRPPRRKPFKIWGRNHRKLVVVDGKVGFTGGFGISAEWVRPGAHGAQWRDSNIRAEGPVVRQMQQAFASHWLETGGALLPPDDFERALPCGDARACFVTSMDVKGLSNARWITHIAMAAAQRRLWIANAYFVPPPDLVRTLCAQSSDKEVDVRVLVPGAHIDHKWIRFLQRGTYRALSGCGVRVYEYQPSMIHAKTMLVDDDLSVVGSTNFDPLSQEVLEEGSMLIRDRDVAAALEVQWALDLQKAKLSGPDPFAFYPSIGDGASASG